MLNKVQELDAELAALKDERDKLRSKIHPVITK